MNCVFVQAGTDMVPAFEIPGCKNGFFCYPIGDESILGGHYETESTVAGVPVLF